MSCATASRHARSLRARSAGEGAAATSELVRPHHEDDDEGEYAEADQPSPPMPDGLHISRSVISAETGATVTELTPCRFTNTSVGSFPDLVTAATRGGRAERSIAIEHRLPARRALRHATPRLAWSNAALARTYRESNSPRCNRAAVRCAAVSARSALASTWSTSGTRRRGCEAHTELVHECCRSVSSLTDLAVDDDRGDCRARRAGSRIESIDTSIDPDRAVGVLLCGAHVDEVATPARRARGDLP